MLLFRMALKTSLFIFVILFTALRRYSCEEFVQNFSQNVSWKIIDESQMKRYLQDSREVYYLNEQKLYIGGKRINDDRLRLETFDEYNFEDLQDFYLEVTYPKQNDYYITYVSCLVEQSSSIGRAYITDGGIGYTNMRLILEAKRIKHFNYRIFLFGRQFT